MAAADSQIPVFDVRVTEEDVAAVEATLRSGWLTMGPRTGEFEERFAEHSGSRHVLAVSSCTGALHLACLAADIGPGDEVIVPSITFVATVNAVRYCGATPIFADIVSSDDLGIDVDHVEALIGPRTKAVLPVHYAGYAVEIKRLVALADERGLAVIEDSAHAPSARAEAGGKRLGSFGLAGCHSFFPNKVLGIGEGGALCTDDDELAQRVRRLRSQGMTATTMDRHNKSASSYDVFERGYNYRFDDPRAALLLSRFARLEEELAQRRRLVARYREAMADVEGISIPYGDFDVELSSVYLMGLLADGPEQRRAIRSRLSDEHGVQTTMYPAVHTFSAYREAYGEISLPRSEAAADRLFSIPLFPHMTEAQQERVIAAIRESVQTVATGAGGTR